MRYRFVFSLAAVVAAVFAIVGPAFAFDVVVPVPEPTTLSLLAAGIAGAIVAARFKGRK